VTLVVARMVGSSVLVASDLRLTHEWGIRRGYTQAATLKAVTINPTTCVAFAGDYRDALDGLRHAAAMSATDVDVIADELVALGVKGAEFLLASSRPPRIHRVSSAGVERDLPVAWIGDPAAFAGFQQRFHTPTPLTGFAGPPASDAEITAMNFIDAFRRLVADEPVATVGDAWVLVAGDPRDGLFHYLSSGLVVGTLQGPTGEEWSDVQVGGVAEGAFRYVVMRTIEPGIGAIALYFDHIGLGVLYHPLQHDDPQLYRDQSAESFRDAVREDHGLAIA